MTPYDAEQYLRRLGNGDMDKGLDVANATVQAAGVEITGDGIYRDHRPICHPAWRQPFGYQVAVVAHYLAGCPTVVR